MKIAIRTTMHMPEIPNEVELEKGSARDVLESVFRGSRFAGEIIDPRTGELALEGHFQVSLNGVPVHALPKGMDTPLSEGDTLTLALILIGGG